MMETSNRRVDKLPLEWVRVFEAAGRTGNFTAAAREIGLTQAAVSQRIQNLERRLGARLFTREARGVTLTIEGEAWLPHVSQALRSLDRSADALFGKPLQKLVLSASASVIQLWIVPRLAGLDPGTQVQLSLTTMNIEPDFARSNAAIEIRYGSGHWPGMDAARLYAERLAPMAAPALLRGEPHWQALPRIAVSGPRPGWQEWAERSGDASVIFCEIVGLRSGTGGDPDRFLRRLHAGFSMIDELCVAHGIQKIKTSGSIFIAAPGLSAHREDHAEAAVGLALALQDELAPKLGVALAIGVNSGPVVSGVIGVNRPTFDIWGDTVNTAQRVSSHGPIGEVSVSALTFAKINHRFSCEAQEPIELKGKGSMRTYVVRALRGGSP